MPDKNEQTEAQIDIADNAQLQAISQKLIEQNAESYGELAK